jgi:hypothetical protein
MTNWIILIQYYWSAFLTAELDIQVPQTMEFVSINNFGTIYALFRNTVVK